MSQSTQPDYQFTFASPIHCPRCGGKAPLMRRSLDPRSGQGEVRTFECETCSLQTEMRAA